jgi:hypothetical protein
MIKYVIKLGALSGVLADKCTELCTFDGPSICTDGSWTKNGSICHKYLFKGDPQNKEYCYHTAATKESCPGNGKPVKVEDVDSLIAFKRGGSTTQTPTTLKPTEKRMEIFPTVQPMSSSRMQQAVVTTTPKSEVRATLPVVKEGYWERLEKNLTRPDFFLYHGGSIWDFSDEIRKLGADATWEQMKGPQLIQYIKSRRFDSDNAVRRVFMVANAVSVEDMETFAVESGLRQLCLSHSELLKKAMELSMSRSSIPYLASSYWTSDMDDYTVFRKIDEFCPGLVSDSVDIRAFLLSIKLLARFNPRVNRQVRLDIHRENCFSQSSSLINAADPRDLALGIPAVSFRGENAFGEGVVKDWFSLFAKGLMESGIMAMIQEGKRNTYLVEGLANMNAGLYTAAGRFLALALIHRRPVGITLPSWFYARIMGVPVTLNDIRDEEPHVFAMLDLIMKATTNSELEMYPMDINGEEVQPTLENREEVVARRIRALIPSSVETQFEAIRQAFISVVPVEISQTLLTPQEIRNFIVGNPAVDVEDMITNMQYRGGNAGSPQIVWLHRLLRALTPQQLRQFVHLVTSSSHVPFEGFRGLKPRMLMDLHSDTKKLPKTSTCFNQLHLPKYETEDELRDKVLHAIANAEVPMHYAPN